MMQRIFHKILVPILAICLIAPFFVSNTFADTTGGNFSVTSRVEYIRGYTENGGYYDWTTNIVTTVNFYTPFTGQFRLRTDGINPIYTTGRADVEGAVLLTVGNNGLYVDFQTSECSSFTYTQTYDYRTGYSTNIYGSVLNGSYQNGTIIQYIDNVETELSNISYYIDGVEASLNNIENLLSANWHSINTSYGVTSDFSSFNYNNGRYTNSYVATSYLASDINNTNILRLVFGVYNYSILTSYDLIWRVGSQQKNLNEFVKRVTYYKNYIVFYVVPDYRIGNLSDGYLSLLLSDFYYYGASNCSVEYLNYNDPHYYDVYLWLENHSDNLDIISSINSGSSSIISAIDSLKNGDSNTQNIVNSNNQQNQQLSNSITQYDNLENQFKSDFSTHMNQISKPELSNILQAGSWYTTQLTQLFNASGSFQIIFTLPLVLGLALFFIGRGGVVFREGRTETIENRTYKQETADGSTYTKTYRQRHWRKK